MDALNLYRVFSISKNRIVYIAFWLIIPFCGFAIHRTLPVPPTLILFVAGSLLLMLVCHSIANPIQLIVPLVAAVYFLVSQIALDAPPARYLGVVSAILYFVVVIAFGGKLQPEQRRLLEDRMITLSVLLLMAECAWRLRHPDPLYAEYAGTSDPRWIYQYKTSSFMYGDSNGTAIHIIVVLFFIYYRESVLSLRYPKSKMILFVLLVLTISRAAWLGALLGWVYVRFLREQRMSFYIVSLFVVSILCVVGYYWYLLPAFQDDPSFNSKFDLLHHVKLYFTGASVEEWLFGIGFSNSLPRMGVYAHSYFLIYLIESGIVGMMLIVLVFLQFIYFTGRKALIILVPFVVTTASASIMFLPYLFVIMALIYLDHTGIPAERRDPV